jgi:hypothetical protein
VCRERERERETKRGRPRENERNREKTVGKKDTALYVAGKGREGKVVPVF